MMVFFIAGLLAGIGGMFLGVKYTVYPTLGTLQSKAMTGAILGGLGSVKGAIVGALLLGIFEVFVAAFVSSQMRDPIVFVILIVVLLFKPAGLLNKVVDEKV
jgi:branched-chain amino acid transport system permease protein